MKYYLEIEILNKHELQSIEGGGPVFRLFGELHGKIDKFVEELVDNWIAYGPGPMY